MQNMYFVPFAFHPVPPCPVLLSPSDRLVLCNLNESDLLFRCLFEIGGDAISLSAVCRNRLGVDFFVMVFYVQFPRIV